MFPPFSARRLAALTLALLALPAPAALAGKAKPTAIATTTTTATTAVAAPLVPWTLVAPATTSEPRPFSPRDFWDTQIPAGQAADPASSSLVADLNRQVKTYGSWINTTKYSYPVYTASATQPRVPVILDNHPNSPLKAKFAAGVPLPSNARGGEGTDGAVTVWQPSTDTYWEFWRLHKLADGWHAEYGGVLDHASTSPGVFTDGTGTSASGLALLGGQIRPGEYQSYLIPHALKIGIPEIKAGVIRAPATRTDGHFTGGIPMGTRFQVDPSINVFALNIPFATKIVAYAAQRYGIIVGDTSGSVNMYAEDPLTMTVDPWPSLWGNISPGAVMAAFPWDKLRALPPTAPTS